MKLQLAVKHQYFVAMQSGEKLEEYRQVNEYWMKKLFKADGITPQTFDCVIITDGYPKAGDTERTLTFPWRGFAQKTITHPHFGADLVEVFAISVVPDANHRAEDTGFLRRVIRSTVKINAHHYGSSRLVDGNDVFVRLDFDRKGLAHVYSADQAEYVCDAVCPELRPADQEGGAA